LDFVVVLPKQHDRIIFMNILSRDQAFAISPELVMFTELEGGMSNPQWSMMYEKIDGGMQKFKKGQRVLVAHQPPMNHKTSGGKQYRMCKVTLVDTTSYQAEDGPVIRVGDGTESWRIDGAEYAVKV
jgi:hypothetical protein